MDSSSEHSKSEKATTQVHQVRNDSELDVAAQLTTGREGPLDPAVAAALRFVSPQISYKHSFAPDAKLICVSCL